MARHTISVPREMHERIAALLREGSINAKIVNALDTGEISLRDRFAGQALAGISSRPGATPADLVAQIAYGLADAMLAERAKGGA